MADQFFGERAPRPSPWNELVSEQVSAPWVRSFGLAHFDAHLKENSAARDWLELERFWSELDADVVIRRKSGNGR